MFIRTADRQQGNTHSPMADPTGGGGSAAQPVSAQPAQSVSAQPDTFADRRSYGTTGRCWERETQADLRDLEACSGVHVNNGGRRERQVHVEKNASRGGHASRTRGNLRPLDEVRQS